MKMYLISDNIDTLTGMRLAGVDGVVIHSMKHLKEQLDYAFTDLDIGIILITEKLGKQFPDMIKDVKLHRRFPLICEIPDRHGTGRSKEFVSEYVSQAIGLKL